MTRLRHPAGDARGVAMVEFALIAPVLLILLVAAYQLSAMIFVQRKVTVTARTIADLTAQSQVVLPSDLDTILNASQQVMSPFAVNQGTYVVSQIGVDTNGNATVTWSRGLNTPALAKGAAYALPATIKQNDTSLIVADATYRYTPSFGAALISGLTLRDRSIMWPRKSGSIACSAC